MFDLLYNSLTSHESKIMLKILQARIQQYVSREIPDVKTGFRKAEEPDLKLPTSTGSYKKAREFHTPPQKIYFCFIDCAKVFDCRDHNKLWKILKEMGTPDHTHLLSNLYAGQEATVTTGHGTMNWFKIGKGSKYISRLYTVTLLI